MDAGYRWPQFSINRGKLQEILLDAVIERMGPECALTGHHVASRRETPNGVCADFINKTNGTAAGSYEGALLIGADGIHSGVREKLNPEESHLLKYLVHQPLTVENIHVVNNNAP